MTKQELRNLIYESVGRASMCWSEPPRGVFLSSEAQSIAEGLLKGLENPETLMRLLIK